MLVTTLLAGLIVVTFNGFQQKKRNTERQTDIKTLYRLLEDYYEREGEYPKLAQLQDNAWIKNNIQGLKQEVLYDPLSNNQTISEGPEDGLQNRYIYITRNVNNAPCLEAAVDCTQFTLIARYEGGGTFIKKSNN